MWLSPLKGAHLTLGQLDKTLPVDKSVAANAKIERGSIVFIKAGTTGKDTPCFQLYTGVEAGKPNAVPYIALMGINDFQAGMAGSVGQAPEADGIDKLAEAAEGVKTWLGSADVVGAGGVKGPRITAISLVQPAEWQTTAFDKAAASLEAYYVGMPLTVNDDGVVAPWASGKNIVGYVTAVPTKRWINDLGASKDGARISGGNALVIEFSTAWIPVAASGAGGPDGAGTAPGALNVGGAKVAGAKSDAKAGAPADANGGNAPHQGK